MRTAYRLTKAAWRMVFLGGLLLWASSALAQPDASYRELVRKALTAFDEKQWEQARALFEAAHAVEPNARTLRGLGMVAFEMEDFVAAYRLLDQSLRDPRRPLDAALRDRTQALLQRTRLLVGRVRLDLTPKEARVKLDGDPVASGDDLWLTIGLHVFTFEADGYETKKLSVDIRNGDDQELAVVLDAITLLAAPLHDSQQEVAQARVASSLERPTTAPGRSESRPLLKQWWFWAAAGGVVAVGVGAAVLASRSGHEDSTVKGTNGVVITTLSLK